MYIKESYCISPQNTFDYEGINGYTSHNEIRYYAIEPDYIKYIPKGLLRRMGKAVRMGVGSGLHLLQQNSELDGIVMASTNGAIEDCFKFLNQMIDYEEGTLTPTHFVQSTPNAPAGQLAMMNKTTGYNITHVSAGLAFEAALLDTKMLMDERAAKTILLGAVEELSECHFVVNDKVRHFKKEDINANQLFESNTEGSVYGEGAAYFILSDSPTESAIKILDVDQITYPDQQDIDNLMIRFLDRNNFTTADIDAVVVGLSGDSRFDHRYYHLINEMYKDQWIYTYKNLVGEYPTSSGFATWMSYQVLKNNPIPKEAIFRTSEKKVNRILIYNHFYDKNHGMILIENTNP
ncbi:MAG: beta-ketoacyl synthase chain length factor [Cyclobacteriaceae bacterium]|nr:beta-ketoacyl synthase chain length factor [Cyclobacteriaceae bacterium]